MTMATLSHVHTSPRKPCASAPRSRSSGTLARCSSLRRGRAPGAGRRFKASAPPPSRARFIHWLTAPLLTPRASAMCCWDHPCCLSSKALKRLPSRQSVASLESELSMSRSYHQCLAIFAEVSKCMFLPTGETPATKASSSTQGDMGVSVRGFSCPSSGVPHLHVVRRLLLPSLSFGAPLERAVHGLLPSVLRAACAPLLRGSSPRACGGP